MLRLGIRENLAQLSLLVVVNAFVGAAMWTIAGLTLLSGLVTAVRCAKPCPQRSYGIRRACM